MEWDVKKKKRNGGKKKLMKLDLAGGKAFHLSRLAEEQPVTTTLRPTLLGRLPRLDSEPLKHGLCAFLLFVSTGTAHLSLLTE